MVNWKASSVNWSSATSTLDEVINLKASSVQWSSATSTLDEMVNSSLATSALKEAVERISVTSTFDEGITNDASTSTLDGAGNSSLTTTTLDRAVTTSKIRRRSPNGVVAEILTTVKASNVSGIREVNYSVRAMNYTWNYTWAPSRARKRMMLDKPGWMTARRWNKLMRCARGNTNPGEQTVMLNDVEAEAKAAEEGLVLTKTDENLGRGKKRTNEEIVFKGVYFKKNKKSRQYEARLTMLGASVPTSLGYFDSQTHAALVIARAKKATSVPAPATNVTNASYVRPELDMNAADAVAAAQAEGLTLAKAAAAASGFRGVLTCVIRGSVQYKARVDIGEPNGPRSKQLGIFECAEAAALAVARYEGPSLRPSANLSPAEQLAAGARLRVSIGTTRPPSEGMTSSEAIELARSEGLELERSSAPSGFIYVRVKTRADTPRFQAIVETTYLGTFPYVEAAALAVARYRRQLGDEVMDQALARQHGASSSSAVYPAFDTATNYGLRVSDESDNDPLDRGQLVPVGMPTEERPLTPLPADGQLVPVPTEERPLTPLPAEFFGDDPFDPDASLSPDAGPTDEQMRRTDGYWRRLLVALGQRQRATASAVPDALVPATDPVAPAAIGDTPEELVSVEYPSYHVPPIRVGQSALGMLDKLGVCLIGPLPPLPCGEEAVLAGMRWSPVINRPGEESSGRMIGYHPVEGGLDLVEQVQDWFAGWTPRVGLAETSGGPRTNSSMFRWASTALENQRFHGDDASVGSLELAPGDAPYRMLVPLQACGATLLVVPRGEDDPVQIYAPRDHAIVYRGDLEHAGDASPEGHMVVLAALKPPATVWRPDPFEGDGEPTFPTQRGHLAPLLPGTVVQIRVPGYGACIGTVESRVGAAVMVVFPDGDRRTYSSRFLSTRTASVVGETPAPN